LALIITILAVVSTPLPLSIEHCNSRLKETRKLAKHQFRGFERISATLAVLAMMAVALSKARHGELEEVRFCARRIA